VFLAPKIVENAAKAMLLTGKVFNASEAKEMQIVNEIVSNDAIAEHVEKFAAGLVKGVSAQSVALTKQLLLDIQGKNLDESLHMAAAANAAARATEDCKKGISSFLNKEKIVW
jgi:methylglutaconyl-CoA hydratase